jgi:hypothetical protein
MKGGRGWQQAGETSAAESAAAAVAASKHNAPPPQVQQPAGSTHQAQVTLLNLLQPPLLRPLHFPQMVCKLVSHLSHAQAVLEAVVAGLQGAAGR